MSDDDRLLTAEEVAALLFVPVSWVREHTRAGHVPRVPLPGSRLVRYRREDVLAWVESLVEGGGPSWRKYRPIVVAAGQLARGHATIETTTSEGGEER